MRRFREYDDIVYLDAGGRVDLPLMKLVEATAGKNNTAAVKSKSSIFMRDNGIGIGKNSLFRNEFSDNKSLHIPNANNQVLLVCLLWSWLEFPDRPRWTDSSKQPFGTTEVISRGWRK